MALQVRNKKKLEVPPAEAGGGPQSSFTSPSHSILYRVLVLVDVESLMAEFNSFTPNAVEFACLLTSVAAKSLCHSSIQERLSEVTQPLSVTIQPIGFTAPFAGSPEYSVPSPVAPRGATYNISPLVVPSVAKRKGLDALAITSAWKFFLSQCKSAPSQCIVISVSNKASWVEGLPQALSRLGQNQAIDKRFVKDLVCVGVSLMGGPRSGCFITVGKTDMIPAQNTTLSEPTTGKVSPVLASAPTAVDDIAFVVAIDCSQLHSNASLSSGDTPELVEAIPSIVEQAILKRCEGVTIKERLRIEVALFDSTDARRTSVSKLFSVLESSINLHPRNDIFAFDCTRHLSRLEISNIPNQYQDHTFRQAYVDMDLMGYVGAKVLGEPFTRMKHVILLSGDGDFVDSLRVLLNTNYSIFRDGNGLASLALSSHTATVIAKRDSASPAWKSFNRTQLTLVLL
eukprot:GILI01022444.1.p1 GENE.GILI01022444.1~~GILI01022444.1.p1  ORF type:complete len:456 (-),score=33.09 GILI01022444.1:24-1391(-)